MDGRNLSIPLWWIPTLHNADPAEREKYIINRGRTLIYWDPRSCAINEIVRIAGYPIDQSMKLALRPPQEIST